MDISLELRLSKGKHEKCLPFFYENIQKNEPFPRFLRLIHVKLNLK